MKKLKALLAGTTTLCLCASNLPVMEQVEPVVNFISASAEDVATWGTCGKNLLWFFNQQERILTISGIGEMTDYTTQSDWSNWTNDIKQVIIGNGVTTIGGYAFYYCSALESVTIPDSVTIIDSFAFYSCSALESVTISNSVTTIDSDAFCSCSALESVTIPDSVTTIGSAAFERCFALKSVTIPDSVTEIDSYTFIGCPLESVIIPKSVTTIDMGAFGQVTRYYPNGESEIFSVKSITIENPECEIYDSSSTIANKEIIYGYENSTAQAYAEKYNREFVLIGEAPEPTEAPEIKKGDVSLDNTVDIVDVIVVNKSILGQKTLTEQERKSADVDNDGKVTPTDSLNIMKYIVNLIDSFD